MRKFLASLALTVGLIHPSIASEILQIDTKLSCASWERINETLEKYGEIPFVNMNAYRALRNNDVMNLPAIMFVNPKTKSYTLVEKFSDQLYCVVSIGEQVSPSTDK